METRSPEPINDELKQHALGVSDWAYARHVQVLHEWADRFNSRLELHVETPAIALDRLRGNVMGSYRRDRNSFGLHHEITVNTRHLQLPLAETLDTLLHELIHEWQLLHGYPGAGNYHNKQFRAKALSFGLLVDEWGRSLGVIPGAFTQLLEEFGVDTTTLPPISEEPIRVRPRGESKLKKWTCGCTNIWAAVLVNASCLFCGQRFERPY